MRLSELHLAAAAAFVCLGVGSPVVAQGMDAALPGYVLVAESDQATFFVHADSIRRDGTFLEAWELWNYRDPDGTAVFLSRLALIRFDCAGRRSGEVAVTYYTLRGASGESVVGDTYADPAMRAQAPGTLGEAVLDFVCARG